MTQQYTPVTWQDETTSQQGTLINAERLNQMQTAHHYADGFEEVDAVPTADPSVAYHKVVYCTADSTFYRWDGTEWTKDIDDDTKALLQQEIARATAAEGVLHQQLEDEHDARVDAVVAINDRITDEATELAQRIATETSTRYTADTALGTRITNETSARQTADTGLGNRITAEATARAEADTLLGDRITAETTAREGADTALGNRITAEETRATQAEQANAQAIANTYTKGETDTLLASKADQATTLAGYGITDAYTKTEADTLLGAKANDNAVVHLAGNEDIGGTKTFTSRLQVSSAIEAATNLQNSNLDYTTPNNTGVRITMFAKGDMNDLTNRVAVLRTYLRNGGHNTFYLTQIGKDGQGQSISSNIELHLNQPIWGNAVLIPSPASNAPSNAAATLATLDGYAPMVRTSGNQSIEGKKTFYAGIETGKSDRPNDGTIFIRGTGAVRRVRITSNDADQSNRSLSTAESYPLLSWDDKNGDYIGNLSVRRNTDNKTQLLLWLRNADTTTKQIILGESD